MKRRHFIKGMAISTSSLAFPAVAGAARYLPLTGVGKNSPTPCDTACHIGDKLARQRERNYKKWKQSTLNATCGSSAENLSIPVDPQVFLDMLKSFAPPKTTKYNGIRMYFATGDKKNGIPACLPDTQVGKLTVIFAPTTPNPNYDKSGGDDDPSQYCWLYEKNNYKFLDVDTAQRWIYKYRNSKREGTGGLSMAGQKRLHSEFFQETCCIWYKMGSIAGDPNQQDCGMIGYLSDRIGNIDSMKISFGAYSHSERPNFPYYQILAQFYIHEKNAPPTAFIALGSSTGEDFCKIRNLAYDGTTDTGLPCPPAPPCSGGL